MTPPIYRKNTVPLVVTYIVAIHAISSILRPAKPTAHDYIFATLEITAVIMLSVIGFLTFMLLRDMVERRVINNG